MRGALLAWLGPKSRIQTSYEPHRRGFFVTSSRPLRELREGFPQTWVRRVTPLHESSGRYFLEPTPRLLEHCLRRQRPDLWWNSKHQEAARLFFSGARRDRIRRLPRGPFVRAWVRGVPLLTELALRLESLAVTPQPERHWRALEKNFDDLWRRVPLHARPHSAMADSVFAYLHQLEQFTETKVSQG